jgi:hypothetical protein
MGILDWFGKKAQANPPPTMPPPPPPPAKKIKAPEKNEKELATEKGEPWISIVKLDIDPDNLHQGSFELDWNEKFVADLIRAGYMIKRDDTDSEIVDRWFQTICRHVVMETYEQTQAINNNSIVKVRDLGAGRSEIS